jgi:hypothetical protein
MDLWVLFSRTGIIALIDYKTDLKKKVSAVSIPPSMATPFLRSMQIQTIPTRSSDRAIVVPGRVRVGGLENRF